jgi:hypothetical protein
MLVLHEMAPSNAVLPKHEGCAVLRVWCLRVGCDWMLYNWVVLGALGSLSLLSIDTIHPVCYPRPCRL